MGRTWGANELGSVSTLDQVVAKLNPKTKQAMYAAANKGLIRRGTWDGCAFNAAGHEVEASIASIGKASQTFELSESVVSNFIDVWDRLQGDDEEATDKLKGAILKAGLFSETNESNGRRFLRETVYRSYENRMKDQFEQMVEGLDMNDETDLVFDIHSAAELLSVS